MRLRRTAGLLLAVLLGAMGATQVMAMTDKEAALPKAGAIAAYGKPVASTTNVPLVFADFTLTPLEKEVKDLEPVTLTLVTERYEVDTPGAKQTLEIRHTQLPPQPLDFSVAGKQFTLTNFRLPDGTRLEPTMIAVFKK